MSSDPLWVADRSGDDRGDNLKPREAMAELLGPLGRFRNLRSPSSKTDDCFLKIITNRMVQIIELQIVIIHDFVSAMVIRSSSQLVHQSCLIGHREKHEKNGCDKLKHFSRRVSSGGPKC